MIGSVLDFMGGALHGVTLREALGGACDILVVYYLIYRALLLVKGTRAAQMLIALVLVAGGFYLARVFELTTLLWLLDNLINYSIIFLIVIFQQDIRRALQRLGGRLVGSARQYEETHVFEEVIRAAEQLARSRIGALIVFQRDAALEEFFSEAGEVIDGRVSKELLVALFIADPRNHVHDGAIVIRNLRVYRAGCVLPLSANRRLDKALGTRHRAAIGITEETDAVVVVVSEERGSVSLCFGGNIAQDLDGPTLRKALLGLFQKEPPAASRAITRRKIAATREATQKLARVTAPIAADAPLHVVPAVAPSTAPSAPLHIQPVPRAVDAPATPAVVVVEPGATAVMLRTTEPIVATIPLDEARADPAAASIEGGVVTTTAGESRSHPIALGGESPAAPQIEEAPAPDAPPGKN